MQVKYVQQVTNEISLGLIKNLRAVSIQDDTKHQGVQYASIYRFITRCEY
jgi:hypothetical protein